MPRMTFEKGLVVLDVAPTGGDWKRVSVKPTSPVVAYLYNQGSPWYDVASGLTYRWPQ